MTFRRNLPIFLLAALAGCEDPTPPPILTIGEIGVPEAAVTNLDDAERAIFADLVSFGAAVAAERIESLVEPIARRDVETSLVAALSVHLAARELGLEGQRLRAAYEENPESELDVRHVVRLVEAGDPSAAVDSARSVAATVAERAAAGEDFAALAAEYSEEPGAAERGGLLEPGRRGSWVEPFWNAASALSPGEVTGVVETEYGFHVIRLDDRRPVPFEEANLTELLRRIVPPDAAAASIQVWAATSGSVIVDPPALRQAWDALQSGEAVPDTLVIARGAAGGQYTGDRLAAGWARLSPEERDALSTSDLPQIVRWVEGDAREAIWADVARQMGAEPAANAASEASIRWQSRALGWAVALGFEAEQPHQEIVRTAGQALLSGAPTARAARAEIRSLRPLLRDSYPVVAFTP